jgi:glycosyltransferase involved in cell wall biosynthesis
MTNPLVSVITPSYNQDQFISGTLKSVKNQLYNNIEHIVVDGNSDDETIEILQKHETQYNLKWISEPDRGQADAIRKGFKMADGSILCWLNSDDMYLTNKTISTIVDLFKSYPDVDVISGQGVILSSDGDWVRIVSRPEKKVSAKHLRYGHTILQPATFWRSTASEDLEFDLSLTYAFDCDYFIRMFEKYNVLPINDCIAGYRMWGENKTASGDVDRARELMIVTGRYLGTSSWQYKLLRLYYAILRLGNNLPEPLGEGIINATEKTSKIIRKITYERVTSV